MALPKKILTRKDEITADFFKLIDKHIIDLLNKKVNHKFHASDFAQLLFIHPRHLSNTIKLTTGKSPCDFVEERIIAEAERFLTETKMSIAEIGQVFCYDEPTNFTKFFKGMTGITPLQFRKTQLQQV
jgi:AraC family transcriptional regulator of adaptative response / methylphosphotriester-DNA alkyltransferase methyltransferase